MDGKELPKKLQDLLNAFEEIPYDPASWDKTVKGEIYHESYKIVTNLAKLMADLQDSQIESTKE